MPVIFITVRGAQLGRILASPAFKAAASPTQKLILTRFGLKTAQGIAGRTIVISVIGHIINPFDLILVPLSRGVLVTTDEAASQLLRGKVSKAAILTTLIVPASVAEAQVAKPIVNIGKALVRINQILFLRQTSSGDPTSSQLAVR